MERKKGIISQFIKFILLVLLILPLPVFAQNSKPDEVSVISYRNLDTKKINMEITSAEKKQNKWVFNPLSIALRFHKVSEVRWVDIKQKNDRVECPLKSVITIVEEGFLDDQLRGRWTEFHLERKNCTKAWNVKELRQAYLCGREGSREVYLKDLCPEINTGKVTDVWIEMTPEWVVVPCDSFPYTFNVIFKISVNGPTTITFQRIRSDGAVAPVEEIIFQEAGSKIFEDYYRVGEPGEYWFGVEIISPNRFFAKTSSKVICHGRN